MSEISVPASGKVTLALSLALGMHGRHAGSLPVARRDRMTRKLLYFHESIPVSSRDSAPKSPVTMARQDIRKCQWEVSYPFEIAWPVIH